MPDEYLKTGTFGVLDNGLAFVIVNDLLVYENGEFDYVDDVNDDLSLLSRKIIKLSIAKSFNQVRKGCFGEKIIYELESEVNDDN